MSPNMEAILTPRFFASDQATWSPKREEEKDSHNEFLPLALGFQDCQVPWKSRQVSWNNSGLDTLVLSKSTSRRLSLETDWAPAAKISVEPPLSVTFLMDWQDDVSLLNDDPDDDDVALLPYSTCNVLAPLLDEMYKDESEVDWEEDNALHFARNGDDWNEAEVL